MLCFLPCRSVELWPSVVCVFPVQGRKSQFTSVKYSSPLASLWSWFLFKGRFKGRIHLWDKLIFLIMEMISSPHRVFHSALDTTPCGRRELGKHCLKISTEPGSCTRWPGRCGILLSLPRCPQMSLYDLGFSEEVEFPLPQLVSCCQIIPLVFA